MAKRSWLYIAVILFLAATAGIFAIDYHVTDSTQHQVYSDLQKIPKNKVGLLLGTAKYQSKGVINLYYQNRINAAVQLYKAGKIDFILVSGDNSTQYYNEPLTMKRDLMAQGVPAEKIFLDNAGLRTLDSILRCRDIFGEDHITIISQEWHNERALYIANHKKVNAIAFNAAEGDSAFAVTVREKLARVKMVIDLLMNKQAKEFYGNKVEIK